MVNKITTPPTTSELIGTVNEIIDAKQDTLVSGTNIKTINGNSLLGSGNIDIQGGSSYTAGTGIDITNDVISVTNAISTGAALGATAVQPSDLATVATSGNYNDLSNKPTIPTVPTNVSAFTNDAGYITSSALTPYATTSYVDSGLSGKQETLVSGTNIKTVNNQSLLGSGNIEIQGGGGAYTAGDGIDITSNTISIKSSIINGAELGTTALQVGDNISDLNNDSGYITSSALSGYEQTSNKVTSISSSSTNTQYPSAKCVYDIVGDIETLINAL